MASFQNLSGRVLTIPKLTAATTTKKAWAKFRLQVGENIHEVVCFDSVASIAAQEVTELGAQITVAGKADSKGPFRFIADAIVVGGKAVGKKPSSGLSSEESKRMKESGDATLAQYKLVIVTRDDGHKQTLPASEVVWFKDRPMAKIDFLMDYYGAKEIADQIRLITGGNLPGVANKTLIFSKYKTWRDHLVQEALRSMNYADVRNGTNPVSREGANEVCRGKV